MASGLYDARAGATGLREYQDCRVSEVRDDFGMCKHLVWRAGVAVGINTCLLLCHLGNETRWIVISLNPARLTCWSVKSGE